jgi:hypothetical protein
MELAKKHTGGLLVALALLMAISRADHFGSATHLPDASWAMFVLAGFYLPRWVLPFLLLEAGLVDYWAISFGGVSGWCFTPAYWFLIPTYAVLWWGGRSYRSRYTFSLRGLADCAATVFAVTCAAFLISNVSFYWLSGYFGKQGPAEYAAEVAQYLPPYLQGVFLYWGFAVLLHIVAVSGTRMQRIART